MLSIDSASDAFWRLGSTRTETGWSVTYRENTGEEHEVGAIVLDSGRFAVWFAGCETFVATTHEFDTAIDCLRDYVDAMWLGSGQ